MFSGLRSRLSLAHLLSALALFVALGGSAYAANTVFSTDIVDGEVKSVDIGTGEVKSLDVANGVLTSDDLAPNSVGSAKITDRQVKNDDLSVGASSSNTIADGGIQGIDVKDGTLTIPKLSFDPATQAELDGHKSSADHDGRYFTKSELDSSDADPPNSGSNRVHWDILAGVPAGFADGVDDVGSANAWSLSGNSGTDPSTDFFGTTDGQPLNLRVNNAGALRLEPASNGSSESPNVVGGSADNAVTAGVFGATIGGGGRDFPFTDAASANKVTDDLGTVGGGTNNQAGDNNPLTDASRATVAGGAGNTASGPQATVAGGFLNTASGEKATVGGGQGDIASGDYSTLAGGFNNTASGVLATAAGGNNNTASGTSATVAGGASNTASGTSATVAGGSSNIAQGQFSFAAGHVAHANHDGAFVWADNQIAAMSSTAANQFIARAAGHFFLQSDSTLHDQSGFINTTTGAFLSTGGIWVNNSDRRLKHHFAALAPGTVLRKLTALPVRSWSYKAEPGVRHIGPVAQDFKRLFRVGADNRHIGTVDEAGVALAAIKALAAQNRLLNRKLGVESRRRSRQARRIARLERGLAALRKLGAAS
jgi:endosialidase-like protein